MRPSGMLDGASLSASAKLSFMSRAMALTRPVQRSVRTGPGLTATKLILSLPYWLGGGNVKNFPAAVGAPRGELPVGDFDAVVADQIDDPALALGPHDRQYVLHAAHVAHELELQRLRPILL